jgi:hypothetical protein
MNISFTIGTTHYYTGEKNRVILPNVRYHFEMCIFIILNVIFYLM